MRSVGSSISLLGHVAIVVAVVLGTAHARSAAPRRPLLEPVIFAQVPQRHERGVFTPVPDGSGTVELPALPAPIIDVGKEWSGRSPLMLPAKDGGGGIGESIVDVGGLFSSSGPEVLSGPLPSYPEELRRAGIQGRVILEAVVDTTGRVEAHSVVVVATTNAGFVAPAREALLATLFRPAQVAGQPTRMRVRIPFEFTLRSGMASGH
jgi:protein TonB